MANISAGVGRKRPNKAQDVLYVQILLWRHSRWVFPAPPPPMSGVNDEATIRAIMEFQEEAAALAYPDGSVDPGGFTLRWLERSFIPAPQHKVFMNLCWEPAATELTDAEFETAAADLGCEMAAIKAVAKVESGPAPFDANGRPAILFERHYFSTISNHLFDRTHPDISNPEAGGYGPGVKQYDRLRRAAMLDEEAALQSASWGAFQIMGDNFYEAGFATVQDMVTAMMEGIGRHLDAFVSFIKSDSNLQTAIKNKNWENFAYYYNGSGYKKNVDKNGKNYADKMRDAYNAISGKH
jgi:hypothetical protein